MKKVFSFFAATAVMLSVGLSSCAEEDPAKPLEVDWDKVATVKGTIFYVPDANDNKLKASSNIKIRATIPYNSIFPGMGFSGNYVIPEGKIDYSSSTGEYSFPVPVEATGNVTITVEDFTGIRKNTSNVDEAVIWSLPYPFYFSASITSGKITIVDYKVLEWSLAKKIDDTL